MMTRLALALTSAVAIVTTAQTAGEVLDRAMADFKAGRIAQAMAGFDRVSALQPEAAPQLWQRGIALYYAGRFDACRRQFESHRTVNPSDVENAAWHFLFISRGRWGPPVPGPSEAENQQA